MEPQLPNNVWMVPSWRCGWVRSASLEKADAYMGVVQLVERWFRESEDFSQVRVLPLIHKFDSLTTFG